MARIALFNNVAQLFDESKVWRTKLLFQIKIFFSNLINVLTIFSIHFATHLMNTSVSFHGKHEIVWVTTNLNGSVHAT